MPSKVYSCSMFFNELDLLELKLNTLDPLVDFFVINESTYTHAGKPKELIFWNNKERFKEFLPKIIYRFIYDTPSSYRDLKHRTDVGGYDIYNHIVSQVNTGNWWNKDIESYGRDTWEKESLITSLFYRADDNDIVLLSDLDEIVKPKALECVLNNFNKDQVYHFQHDMYYYYLNVQKDEPWYGTIATTFKNFKKQSFCKMRTHKQGVFINNGGWHFTYMGGVDKIRKKIHSWGEQSLNTPIVNNELEDNFKYFLERGQDLFFRKANFIIRNINDGTFPPYLVNHQNDIFKNYIYRRE